jgi:hypothetical protein
VRIVLLPLGLTGLLQCDSLLKKTIANQNYAKYVVGCLVSDFQVTVKWRKPSNDEIMAA